MAVLFTVQDTLQSYSESGYAGCFDTILYLEQLQVYERALRCIPEPLYSIDQDAAVFVTV